MRPTITLWPLPIQGNGNQFWWVYTWKNGPRGACPPSAVGIVADYLNDGAFQDPSLLSLSFFKAHPCTYWFPGQDELLRWYSKKFVNSPTRINDITVAGNYADQFLSFRGHSEWIPYRTTAWRTDVSDPGRTTTDFYPPNSSSPTYRMNGRYAVNIDKRDGKGLKSTYLGGYKYSNNHADNTPLPNYAVLPNRMIDADVIVSRNPPSASSALVGSLSYYRYLPDNWNGQRNGGPGYESKTNPPNPYSIAWSMFIRKTSMTWEGKPVLYVGFSEGFDSATGPTGKAMCEEWWFAKDVGPIYIATYPLAPLATCRNSYLAVNQGFYKGTEFIPYYNNPEGHFATSPNLVGYLKQVERCIVGGCKVVY